MRNILRDQRGISLAELLVAVVIFAILFLVIDSVFISAHRSSRKAELGADVQQNARIAIERLTREIREADASDIRIAADGSWVAVAFKSARSPTDNNVFCIDVMSGPLNNSACNPPATGDTFAPLWQRWIVYTFTASTGEIKREVQPLNPNPTTPGGGQVIATFVEDFTASISGASSPTTFSVTIKARAQETVQGSLVPPQQILLNGTTLIRN